VGAGLAVGVGLAAAVAVRVHVQAEPVAEAGMRYPLDARSAARWG